MLSSTAAAAAAAIHKNLEIMKIEKNQKADLRMISSAAFKLRSKYMKIEDPSKYIGHSEASSIRMYETHIPGFCYLKNGEYRRWARGSIPSIHQDPVMCSEKVKELIFTNHELDVEKVMCLHLLGTQVHNKRNIQRKDGRVCSFVKSSIGGSKRHSLQYKAFLNDKEISLTSERVLPRYVLDITSTEIARSSVSIKTSDYDTGSDEDSRASHRKSKIPIFINNEIRVIVSSVIDALESVNSPKLNKLKNLANSPEELRAMLLKDNVQEYIFEMAGDQLVLKPTSYDYIITHPMFDKIPDTGTLETAAQVLEVNNDDGLHTMLAMVRKAIARKYKEVVKGHHLERRKSKRSQENKSISRTSFSSHDIRFSEDKGSKLSETRDSVLDYRRKSSARSVRRSTVTADAISLFKAQDTEDGSDYEAYRHLSKADEPDYNKYDFRRLSNGQRIFIGLTVAALKSKEANTFPYESRKKIDMPAIIRASIAEDNRESLKDLKNSFTRNERRRESASRSRIQFTGSLENLTRGLLIYLRYEIATIENEKKVDEFLSKLR